MKTTNKIKEWTCYMLANARDEIIYFLDDSYHRNRVIIRTLILVNGFLIGYIMGLSA